jgi:uncharacterized membrane protein
MTRKYFIAGFVLLAACLLATAILYPHLPNQVPSHWNGHGQVDGYSARWTLFLVNPGIMLGLMGIFALLPWLSPRHFEVQTFRSTYLYIMLVILAYLAFVHGLILWAAVSGAAHMDRAILGAVCLLFVLLGNVMGKVRRNFYIGIRRLGPSPTNAFGTPHTVWEEKPWWRGVSRDSSWLWGEGFGLASVRCCWGRLCQPSTLWFTTKNWSAGEN